MGGGLLALWVLVSFCFLEKLSLRGEGDGDG